MEKLSGVNVSGFIDGEFGLGEGVRATIRALETQDIPIAVNNLNIETVHAQGDKSVRGYSPENPFPINIIHLNGDLLLDHQTARGAHYLKDKYNIGYWAWELPEFPSEWKAALYTLDEIWTPSNFCVESFSPKSPVPILKMPHSIKVPETSLTRRRLGLPDRKFIFLFMFDFWSVTERKNPLGLIEAFTQAFGHNEDVLLCMKSINGASHPKEFAELRSLAEPYNNIKLVDGVWERDDVWGLIRNSDCYVSLHRAEGFGLSMAESMYCGKPVIATGYSGNSEYMNVNNSYPVRYHLETLSHDCGHYKKGDTWAVPDLSHAADQMRRVFSNPDESKQIGGRAAQDMRTFFDVEIVGSRMRKRLEYINYLCGGFEEVKAESDKFKQYVQNEIQIDNQLDMIHRLQRRIQMMEESRFWKIRNQWFKLKKLRLISKKLLRLDT